MTTETKTAHTPGPWHIASATVTDGMAVLDDTRSVVARCPLPMDRGWEAATAESEANAALCAAAPDLLEALQKLLEQFDSEIRSEYDGTEWITGRLAEADHARAALAKVRG